MLKNKIILGTRGSRLALWQANSVKKTILKKFPDLTVQIKIIGTEGDKFLNKPLSLYGGKGLFIKALEKELLNEEIDMAVHSIKDVTTTLPNHLTIAATLKREEPFDVIVCKNGGFKDLKQGAVIGSSSLRRMVQLKTLRSDFDFKPLRGNVDTRIEKLFKGEYDAIVLAKAAVKRLNLNLNTEILPIVPACGQGIIGIETDKNSSLKNILCSINDKETFKCANAERKFVCLMGAGCNDPIGVHAEFRDGKATLAVMYAIEKGEEWDVFNFTEDGFSMDGLPEKCAERMKRFL
jgi:hydroxymethylbilane synthase